MTFPLDLRAIGLGLLSYLAGWLALGIMLTAGINLGDELPNWLMISLNVLGNLLPVLAAFASSYLARSRRVLHGVIVSGVCALLVLAGTLLFSNITAAMAINTVGAVLIASLGAMLGNYARSRHEP